MTVPEVHEETASTWFLAQVEELVHLEQRLAGARWPRCRRGTAPAQAQGIFRPAGWRGCSGDGRRGARAAAAAGRAAVYSGSTPAPPSSPPPPPICTRPTGGMRAADRSEEDHGARRRSQPHRPGHRVRLLLRARALALRETASRPSWSTATRRPSRPTTTRPTACTSSRDVEDVLSIVEVERPLRRDRPVRRADAAEAGARPGGNGRCDRRHQPDSSRHRRGRERFQQLLMRLGLKQPPTAPRVRRPPR